MAIPVTRPITTLIHEPIYPRLQSLAATVADGSMSKLLRLLLYKQLLDVGAIDQALLDTLDERDEGEIDVSQAGRQPVGEPTQGA